MDKPKYLVAWWYFPAAKNWRYVDGDQVRTLIDVLVDNCHARPEDIHIYPVSTEMTGAEWLAKKEGRHG